MIYLDLMPCDTPPMARRSAMIPPQRRARSGAFPRLGRADASRTQTPTGSGDLAFWP